MTKDELKKYLVEETEKFTYEEVEKMSNRELLDEFLYWNGIIGWTDTIIEVVEAAYEVYLED